MDSTVIEGKYPLCAIPFPKGFCIQSDKGYIILAMHFLRNASVTIFNDPVLKRYELHADWYQNIPIAISSYSLEGEVEIGILIKRLLHLFVGFVAEDYLLLLYNETQLKEQEDKARLECYRSYIAITTITRPLG